MGEVPLYGYEDCDCSQGLFASWHGGVVVGMMDSGFGTTRAEDAQRRPTQSHVPPSILVYEDYSRADKLVLLCKSANSGLKESPPLSIDGSQIRVRQ